MLIQAKYHMYSFLCFKLNFFSYSMYGMDPNQQWPHPYLPSHLYNRYII